MLLALLFPYLVLNMFRMLIHPSSGACDLFVKLFHGLYCSGSITLWFGWSLFIQLFPSWLTSDKNIEKFP